MEKIRKINYNKLIRDNVINIIKNDPKVLNVNYFNLSEDHLYAPTLVDKLIEESNELFDALYNKDKMLEEISDIEEVLDSIKLFFNISNRELNEIKNKKREDKGSFKNRIFLQSVEEKKD